VRRLPVRHEPEEHENGPEGKENGVMESRVQGPVSKVQEEITFTFEDLELLRVATDIGRATMFKFGLRGKSYEERRYEFAKEWAEGNRWNTARTRAWARDIKRELEEMRAASAAPAAPGDPAGQARNGR
jgi:hypothetical protein